LTFRPTERTASGLGVRQVVNHVYSSIGQTAHLAAAAECKTGRELPVTPDMPGKKRAGQALHVSHPVILPAKSVHWNSESSTMVTIGRIVLLSTNQKYGMPTIQGLRKLFEEDGRTSVECKKNKRGSLC
jgi:hypothetical protein